MALTLRQLKYFVATAESPDLAAAIQLTISQSCGRDERDQGGGRHAALRTPSGVTLPAGRRFLNHAYDPVVGRRGDADSEPRNTLSGTLAIAASYTVSATSCRIVLRLNTLYPRLTIHLHELNRESIEEGLIAGRYDMAVLLTSNVSNPALVLEPVIHSVRRLWVGAHHPLLRHERHVRGSRASRS